MWEEVGKWMIQNHGTAGVLVVILMTAVGALSVVVVYIFRKYTAVNKSLQEQLAGEIARQREQGDACGKHLEQMAEKCRECLTKIDHKHDQDMRAYYDTMRSENHQQWGRLEKVIENITGAITGLVSKVSELAGKLDVLGR